MEPQTSAQWKHEPYYVKTPQSCMDDLIDKSRVLMEPQTSAQWKHEPYYVKTPQKFVKFKELV